MSRARIRLTLLVWGVALAAGVALGVAIAHVAATPDVLDGAFVALLLATLCTEMLTVDLRVGRHVESYTWAEVTLVLGLALLAPAPLVLTSLAIGVVYIGARRAAIKIVFNTASYVVGVTLAVAATHAIGTPTWEEPARSALALAVGAMVFSLWNGLSVSAAIAFAQDVPVRTVYAKGSRLRLFVGAGNVAIGMVLLIAAHVDSMALLALPLYLGVAYFAYRAYLRTVQERMIWRHLEATSQEVNRLDERAVAGVALTRAALLFEADEVRLALYSAQTSDAMRVFTGSQGGVDTVRRIARAPVGSDPTASDGETWIGVNLDGLDGEMGWLHVGFHGRVKLTEREHHLLHTFGNTIARSIENARLYSEMARHAARSETAALHDSLTGLPNRAFLQERAREVFEAADGRGHFAVIMLDLDRFKDVNDAFGHAAGDTVLCEVSNRLQAAVRANDTVCRLGGDEFAILATDSARAIGIAQRLLTVVTQPIDIDGVEISVGGSIGFACYPENGTAFEELLQRADVAMYSAKARRGRVRRYSDDLDGGLQSNKDRLGLVAELRTALDEGQFELHFQPQFELESGRPVGAEALVRWRHPTRGLLEPREFVALVETSNFIRAFTSMVLERALAECSRWQRPGHPLHVAVNISARDLDDESLASAVGAALARHDLPPSCLVLEITETAILGDLEFVERQMARLASLGVRLSIDDFGTGNSSLSFLQRVMVHELKIDRSFVTGVATNENDATITRATIGLAHGLGLRTVAEGVEDRGVARELTALGCDYAQGFLWSRPLPAPEIRAALGVVDVDLVPATDGAATEPAVSRF
ncbi:MAG: EAL domain-containing protein [Actinomycetota bacterium]|nr:EAL domain-containing protein [Actinomycetota bacterium]